MKLEITFTVLNDAKEWGLSGWLSLEVLHAAPACNLPSTGLPIELQWIS